MTMILSRLIKIGTFLVLCSLVFFHSSSAYISIEDYGAVAGENTEYYANVNKNALSEAFYTASHNDDDNVVLVPEGKTYFIDSVYANDIHKIEFRIEGTLLVNADRTTWDETQSAFYFVFCHDIHITGNGTIDGNGWNWWYYVIKTNNDARPLALIDVRNSYNWQIDSITLLNSPQYYIYFYDVNNVEIYGITIDTNPVDASTGTEVYPINTEGITIMASNVYVHDISITTYDDAIAVKPCKSTFTYCQCASNILIENIEVYQAMGISIGGVQPSTYTNCISNVIYNNINLHRPFYGIFIKTYPGSYGSASITNITYSNIYMYNTLWWPIYIGWQSYQQPDEIDVSCTQYPVYAVCPTQSRIDVRDITLRNVIAERSLTYYNAPGVIRCDSENPCRNITFDTVHISQHWATNKNLYTTLEKSIFARFLGESTKSYFWRFIIENVIHGISYCNHPDFQQTLPLPDSNPSSSILPTVDIEELTCPYNPNQAAKIFGVMKAFLLVAASIFAVSAGLFVISLFGTLLWRTVKPEKKDELSPSQHNMLTKNPINSDNSDNRTDSTKNDKKQENEEENRKLVSQNLSKSVEIA